MPHADLKPPTRYASHRVELPTKRPPTPRSSSMGCGIDVVEVPRFRQAITRWGPAFLSRVFTDLEQRYARSHHRTAMLHLAARFAAKEAVMKALAQVAPQRSWAFRQIEIRNDQLGRPFVVLHGAGKRQPIVHISLSHVQQIATAVAIVTPSAFR